MLSLLLTITYYNHRHREFTKNNDVCENILNFEMHTNCNIFQFDKKYYRGCESINPSPPTHTYTHMHINTFPHPDTRTHPVKYDLL